MQYCCKLNDDLINIALAFINISINIDVYYNILILDRGAQAADSQRLYCSLSYTYCPGLKTRQKKACKKIQKKAFHSLIACLRRHGQDPPPAGPHQHHIPLQNQATPREIGFHPIHGLN
jgi:hypothetical protein